MGMHIAIAANINFSTFVLGQWREENVTLPFLCIILTSIMA